MLSICYDYGAALKGSSWELTKVKDELEGLRTVLQALEPLMREAEFRHTAAHPRLPALKSLCGPQGVLSSYKAEMQQLEARLKCPGWSDNFGPRRKALVQSLTWPLKKGETKKAIGRLARYRDILESAVNMDTAKLTIAIHNLELETNGNVRKVKDNVREVHVLGLKTNTNVLEVKDNVQSVHILGCPHPKQT